jgi:hypothetical protein
MNATETTAKMQSCLDRLGIPLTVAWQPNPIRDKHGLIESGSKTLLIFDEEEDEVWQTLLHEALEWKLKEVTSIYRQMINGLIEVLEKIAYREKERFLEAAPEVFKVIEGKKNLET